MATTIIKSWNSDNQAIVDNTGALLVTGTFSASNPSIGTVGGTAPTSATEIAGIDPSGNLRPVSVDGSGKVEIVGSFTASSGFNTLSPGSPTQVTVGGTSGPIFAANASRVYAHIFNNSAGTIYIQYQSAAVVSQGIKIQPGNLYVISGSDLWLGVVNAISGSSSLLIDILEAT